MRKYPGLPTSEWPAGEWAALQSRVSPRSRREANYQGANQSAKQLARLKTEYGCCLAWLKEQGPIDPSLSAAQRWPSTGVERFVDAMKARGYQLPSIRLRLLGLRTVLYRLVPGADLKHLVDEIKLLPKAAPAVPAVVLRVSTADLVKFGITIMEETYYAVDAVSSARFRTGLQIAQLALRPWRATAFSNIMMGKHLQKTADGWRLVAPKTQGRFKRDASGAYPRRLLKYLKRYLEHHRRILCDGGDGGNALWVLAKGKPFSPGMLHHYLTNATSARFESDPISPHPFRKCLTTTVAINNPAAIAVAPVVLGHQPTINEAWYNMAGSVSAFGRCMMPSRPSCAMRAARLRRQTGRPGRSSWACPQT